jgi:hypothetical protein
MEINVFWQVRQLFRFPEECLCVSTDVPYEDVMDTRLTGKWVIGHDE